MMANEFEFEDLVQVDWESLDLRCSWIDNAIEQESELTSPSLIEFESVYDSLKQSFHAWMSYSEPSDIPGSFKQHNLATEPSSSTMDFPHLFVSIKRWLLYGLVLSFLMADYYASSFQYLEMKKESNQVAVIHQHDLIFAQPVANPVFNATSTVMKKDEFRSNPVLKMDRNSNTRLWFDLWKFFLRQLKQFAIVLKNRLKILRNKARRFNWLK